MLERFRPVSVTGPWDRRALLRFASSCLSEIIITYLVACCRLFGTMRDKEIACGLAASLGGIGAGVLQRLGMQEFSIYFRGT